MGRHHPVRLGQLPSVQRLEFGLAVFVVVMATFAIARPGQAMAYTRGVDIVNASSVALRIESTTGFPYGISTPPAGATIDVGRRMHVEVTSQALDSNHGDVIFDIVGSSNRFFVHLSAQPFGGSVQASCTAQGGFACTPENPVIASQVTFLDAPGSVHNLPPDQRQPQANILKQLCANPDTGGLATCELKLISEVAVESPQHQVGGYVNNTTDFEQGTASRKWTRSWRATASSWPFRRAPTCSS